MTRHGADAPGPRFPSGRYGRRREPRHSSRLGLALLAGVVVLAGLGVTAKLYGQYGESAPAARVLRWTVVSDRAIRIEFDVPGDRPDPLRCTLRSRGRDGSEVGRMEVTVPAGRTAAERTVVLTTRERAVTGELAGCLR